MKTAHKTKATPKAKAKPTAKPSPKGKATKAAKRPLPLRSKRQKVNDRTKALSEAAIALSIKQGTGAQEAGQLVLAQPSAAKKEQYPTQFAATDKRTAGIDATELVMLLGALAFWLASFREADQSALTDFGLVSILDWPYWAALGLVSFGFGLSLIHSSSSAWIRASFPIALILLLHATPTVIYGTLRYSWAWKHIGIVDFIQRHDGIDRFASYLSAYHNWPGFFYSAAMISDLIGANSIGIASMARFTSIVLALSCAAMVAIILRHFSQDRRTVAVAVWFYVCGNWIGQDYFAPQAVSYFMFLAIIALCLGPMRRPAPAYATTGRGLIGWASHLLLRDDRQAPAPHNPRLAAWATLLALLLIICIVATHQLTPIATIFALVVLGLLRRISLWLPVFAICCEVSWIVYFASPFVYLHLIEELTNVGEGMAAASNRLAIMAIVSTGQYWVIIVGRLLTGCLVIAAALGGLRRLIAGDRDVTLPALAAAAFALFVSSYGGEILFRVYMFALLPISFFAACLFFPGKAGSNRNALAAVSVAVLGFLVAVGFLMANNGKDRQYSFSADEIEVADWLYSNAPPGTLLVEGSRGYPSQFKNYENFAYIPMSEERPDVREEFVSDPEGIFGRWMSDPKWAAAYLIITRSQKAYSDAEGIMPFGSLQKIEDRLIASPRFQLLKSTRDAKLFVLTPTVGKMGQWVSVPGSDAGR